MLRVWARGEGLGLEVGVEGVGALGSGPGLYGFGLGTAPAL